MGGVTQIAATPSGDANALLNGQFQVDQINENSNGATIAFGAGFNYVCDGWIIQRTGGASLTAGRGPSAVGKFGGAFNLGINATGFAAADIATVIQRLEGTALQMFRIGGDFGTSNPVFKCTLYNAAQAGNLQVPITFVANNWVYCTLVTAAFVNGSATLLIPVPLNSPNGYLLTAGSIGIQVQINLTANTGNLCPAASVNTWIATGSGSIAPGGTIAGGAWQIGDAAFTRGDLANSILTRKYNDELNFALRYYEKSFVPGVVAAQNVGSNLGASTYYVGVAGINKNGVRESFKVPKAKTPALTTYNPAAANANWRNITLAADSGVPVQDIVDANGFSLGNPQIVSDLVGGLCGIHWVADARL